MIREKSVQHSFSPEDMQRFNVPMKVGILGTINPDGLPHLTMISTLQACAPNVITWGQFTEGLSKHYIRQNPKTGFLIMTLDKNLWRGKACFTHVERSGSEYEMYNNIPMFRYNAYFGIHTVHYMELVEHYGKVALPMGSIIGAALKTMAARMISRKRGHPQVLNLWTCQLLNQLSNLKFLGYVDQDGHPLILPVIQAQAFGSRRVAFSTSAFREDLERIPAGIPMAIFGMTLDMEDVLLRGEYQGIRRLGGIRCGVVEIDWVYNSMPPTPQQIYPEVDLVALRSFDGQQIEAY